MEWYNFGRLSADLRSFSVDKQALLRVVQASAEEHECLCVHCPAFSWQRVAADVAALPDQVQLGPDAPGNLRKIFARARQLQPAVLLIDEIDAIAPARDRANHEHTVSVVAQLLVLLDGLEERGRVVVIATTNRLEAVDVAVRRPGRFDYLIEVPLPNAAGREAILRSHMARLKLADDTDVKRLAEATADFSGAELAGVCREAGLIAIKRAIASKTPPDAVRVTQWDLQSGVLGIRSKRS